MLNLIYYVPMQFVGFYVWSRHMNQESHEVEKRHMKNTGRLILLLCMIAGTVLYGYLLKFLGDEMCIRDRSGTIRDINGKSARNILEHLLSGKQIDSAEYDILYEKKVIAHNLKATKEQIIDDLNGV